MTLTRTPPRRGRVERRRPLPRPRTDRLVASPAGGVAHDVAPLLAAFFAHGPPVRFSFWDGSASGPTGGPGEVTVASPDAVRRLLTSPGELGLARAYVAGDLDVTGDLFGVLTALERASGSHGLGPAGVARALGAARRVGALGRPLPPPPEESRLLGRRHSKARDATAISHHYDVGNEFYELVLGPSMTYSCARFDHEQMTLDDAQRSKMELVCRKLGLHERPDQRMLDVGCGWGSLAMHAAVEHGARVVGVTISAEQAQWARDRVRREGIGDRVEIRLQDVRDVDDGPFDCISSIGMFEHVGAAQMKPYFERLRRLTAPHGRLLNHAISSAGGSTFARRSFVGRYVFPDGELIDVGEVALAMEAAGFELRDVESLREHYAETLRRWVDNLETSWDGAVELVGEARARVWRLYMAASAVGFADGGLGIHQTLGVATDADGSSGMPRTRRSFEVNGRE